jgi:Na+/melibiose symporter-like transporter
MGALYASNSVHPSSGAGRWVIIVCIYMYAVFFASTWAVSIKVFAPEIQPQHTRAKATAFAYGSNTVCNWFVAFISPVLLSKSSSAAYFLFGGCCALTTVVCFFFMVETKGKSLDEIETTFTRRGILTDEGVGIKMGTVVKRAFARSKVTLPVSLVVDAKRTE